jgi:REP element-mobilizing transposase RayT
MRMARPLRYYPPGLLLEVTVRTVQGRHLLQPSSRLNGAVLGVIARAQVRYEVKIYGIVVMSNHIHMIISADSRQALVGFMAYANGNIARVVGRLRNWPERFWGRRYRSVPILDSNALLARMRYLFAHGYKEGLVGHPDEWPGIHGVGTWCDGKRLIGTWLNRTAMCRDRHAGVPREASCYESKHEVVLSPPPGWEDVDEEEVRTRMKRLVEEAIETHPPLRPFRKAPQTHQKREKENPHTRPSQVARSPAPPCHTHFRGHRIAYLQAYQRYVDAFRSENLTPDRLSCKFFDSIPIRYFSTLQALN